MKKGYLVFYPYHNGLPDGVYKMTSDRAWHVRLRIRLAYWLLRSVKSNEPISVTTTTGVS